MNDVDPPEMKRCVICDSDIRENAKKCINCKSYQNFFRRNLNFINTTIMSLIVALVSVVTVLIPILQEYGENRRPIVSISMGTVTENHFDVGIAKITGGTAIVSRAALIISRKNRTSDKSSIIRLTIDKTRILAKNKTDIIKISLDDVRKREKDKLKKIYYDLGNRIPNNNDSCNIRLVYSGIDGNENHAERRVNCSRFSIFFVKLFANIK